MPQSEQNNFATCHDEESENMTGKKALRSYKVAIGSSPKNDTTFVRSGTFFRRFYFFPRVWEELHVLKAGSYIGANLISEFPTANYLKRSPAWSDPSRSAGNSKPLAKLLGSQESFRSSSEETFSYVASEKRSVGIKHILYTYTIATNYTYNPPLHGSFRFLRLFMVWDHGK